MSRHSDLVRYASTLDENANPNDIREPSEARKNIGESLERKPIRAEYNWLKKSQYEQNVYTTAKLDRLNPILIRSGNSISWNGSDITFASNIDISFRFVTGEQINRISSGLSPISLADGQVLVFRKDYANPSPVNMAEGDYGAGLGVGQFDIVAEGALVEPNEEHEIVLFRRNGTNLEIPIQGLIVETGETFEFGKPGKNVAVDLSDYVKNDGTTPFLAVQEGVTPDGLNLNEMATVETVVDEVAAHEALGNPHADSASDADLAAAIAAHEGAADPHASYAQHNENETITQNWTFQTPIISSRNNSDMDVSYGIDVRSTIRAEILWSDDIGDHSGLSRNIAISVDEAADGDYSFTVDNLGLDTAALRGGVFMWDDGGLGGADKIYGYVDGFSGSRSGKVYIYDQTDDTPMDAPFACILWGRY